MVVTWVAGLFPFVSVMKPLRAISVAPLRRIRSCRSPVAFASQNMFPTIMYLPAVTQVSFDVLLEVLWMPSVSHLSLLNVRLVKEALGTEMLALLYTRAPITVDPLRLP